VRGRRETPILPFADRHTIKLYGQFEEALKAA
jgi:hypothetical protein